MAQDYNDPLKDKRPYQYPILYLPPFGKPKDFKSLGFEGLSEKVKHIPIIGARGIPNETTLGDIVADVLHRSGYFQKMDVKEGESGDWTPASLPEDVRDKYCEAVYDTICAEENKNRIHSSMEVIRLMQYTELAIGVITVASVGRVLVQQLNKTDYKPHGLELDAISKIGIANGILDGFALLSYSYVANGHHPDYKSLNGMDYATAVMKNFGSTIKNASSDMVHNHYTKEMWSRWFRFNVAPVIPLNMLRTGHPLKEIEKMGGQIKGAIGATVADYSKHMLSELDSEKSAIGEIEKKHPIIYKLISPHLGTAHAELESLVSSGKEGVSDQTANQAGSIIASTSDKHIHDMTQNAVSGQTLESALTHNRNQVHGEIAKSLYSRSSDFVAIFSAILSGAQVAARVALGYEDLARAAEIERVVRQVLKYNGVSD